ncbi:AAA family ATPase [Desulfurobacterium crinifex]
MKLLTYLYVEGFYPFNRQHFNLLGNLDFDIISNKSDSVVLKLNKYDESFWSGLIEYYPSNQIYSLILGENGAGKTRFMDCLLCFPFGDIKEGRLIAVFWNTDEIGTQKEFEVFGISDEPFYFSRKQLEEGRKVTPHSFKTNVNLYQVTTVIPILLSSDIYFFPYREILGYGVFSDKGKVSTLVSEFAKAVQSYLKKTLKVLSGERKVIDERSLGFFSSGHQLQEGIESSLRIIRSEKVLRILSILMEKEVFDDDIMELALNNLSIEIYPNKRLLEDFHSMIRDEKLRRKYPILKKLYRELEELLGDFSDKFLHFYVLFLIAILINILLFDRRYNLIEKDDFNSKLEKLEELLRHRRLRESFEVLREGIFIFTGEKKEKAVFGDIDKILEILSRLEELLNTADELSSFYYVINATPEYLKKLRDILVEIKNEFVFGSPFNIRVLKGFPTGLERLFLLFADIEEAVREVSVKDVLLLLDEPDVFLHVEWQRKFIACLSRFLSLFDKNFQVIIATHSPFLVSDIPSSNIVLLTKDNGVKVEKFSEGDRTLAQNIYALLDKGFFLKVAIGEFVRRKIVELFQKPGTFSKEYRDWFVEELGDRILRIKLKQRFGELG